MLKSDQTARYQIESVTSLITKFMMGTVLTALYVEMLQMHHRYEGQELCNTGVPERFMCFDGAHWVELSKRTVQQHMRVLANRMITALTYGIWNMMERCKDKDKEQYDKLNYHHTQLYKAKLYMGRANNIEGVTNSVR